MRMSRTLILAAVVAPMALFGAAKTKGFIGCTQTKMFHKPNCKYVSEIEKNGTKVTFTRRQEAIQAGYKPCEECKP